jgi:N12 class adenine-specific DNA methylase
MSKTTDKDLGMKDILAEIEKAKKSFVKVGVFENAEPYPNGTTVAEVAFWNEYGTVTIPQRSFIFSTVKENKDKWSKEISLGMKSICNGTSSVDKVLNTIGVKIQAAIQDKILNLNDPPNSPYTIAKKGVNNPLVDSKHLWRNIAYEVVMVEGKNK